VEEVCAFLKIEPSALVKTLLFDVDGQAVAALVRGDRELNEVKLKNRLGAVNVALATPEQVKAWTSAEVGFAGPVKGMLSVSRIVADNELKEGGPWVTGANKTGAHYTGVSLVRDCGPNIEFFDLRTIAPTDPCPRCGGSIEFKRGIEVGHVFKLGLKYSQAMNAKFLDENGKEQIMVMGCYGIGVSRIVAAAIEQNHDENGIIWTPAIAPFEVAVIALSGKDPEVAAKAEELYRGLLDAGVEAVLDDRDERPGVKFKDADLVGYPMQIVAGGKGLAAGIVEAKDRRTGAKVELPLADFAGAFAAWRKDVRAGWGL
jgi:prolyl-tRNA synthetase